MGVGEENRFHLLMREYQQSHITEEHIWVIIVADVFGNYSLPEENLETIMFLFSFFRYLTFLPGCL